MKICLVCSQGGHLTEMLHLLDAFEGHEIVIITHDAKFTRTLETTYSFKTFFIKDITSESLRLDPLSILIHLLIISFGELRVFLKEKPDIIISTGSEIAIPICYLAKIFGKKVIFIESLCRVKELSATGKYIYPIADLFFVQWKSLSCKYKKAKYDGTIL